MSATDRPSIRLSIPASSTGNPAPGSNKKRRYTPPTDLPVHTAAASQLSLVHQNTILDVVFSQQKNWHILGETTLYVIDQPAAAAPSSSSSPAPTSSPLQPLALHLRGTCQVQTISVAYAQQNTLTPLRVSYHHADPLKYVLVKPPTSYTQDDVGNFFTRRHADTQSSRGANGMTAQLRVASLASSRGELRLTVERPSQGNTTGTTYETWRSDLQTTTTNDSTQPDSQQQQQQQRITRVAQKLSSAGQRALRITIQYTIINTHQHLGGLHVLTQPTPHIYTTTGVFGDHEGPRCWVPCLDSAAVAHRGSQQLTVKVTALVHQGLWTVGMGDDYGVSSTFLHDGTDQNVGSRHLQLLQHVQSTLPPNWIQSTTSKIWATHIWSSATWTPSPIRSLGFAIGPFRVVDDPEYAPVQENEGIRNIYFAPLKERPYIHVTSNKPENELDQVFLHATTGVPHRALSLMRDVLAIPVYRTSSYTQVWIPNAVHGGFTSGSMHDCPEVLVNPFLGGAIVDSCLLAPPQSRLPYHQGGRVLQFLQARNAIRGWITACVPLGGNDDVGHGYIHTLIEALIISLYERGHGAYGEGGARGSVFYSQRYSLSCGLNSTALDFLPIQNVDEVVLDSAIGGLGAVPIEERHSEFLWRSASNGSESHTSSVDEFNLRLLLCKDAVEAIERGTDKDKGVPSPSMGWFGSYLSMTFLSSNASSSTDLGCGAVDMMHPTGGLVYRALKSEILRSVVEGRASIANFTRLVRAAFIASHLDNMGEKELKILKRKSSKEKESSNTVSEKEEEFKPPFVICVNEILKKKGLTHTLFTRALQNLSGRIREAQLFGTLVDVERHAEDPRSKRPLVEPEGFPNVFVRGACPFYCRVGVQVEQANELTGSTQVASKGVQVQMYAEPVVPEGGLVYTGPITIRVVENEGQFREYVKTLTADCSRRDWGAAVLHAKPVTTQKVQTAASGTLEGTSNTKDKASNGETTTRGIVGGEVSVFTEAYFHSGGYQALELIRLTNLTPLLWVRVDPQGLYAGRLSIFLPDACLAEQLFHDGDAAAQVEACRALAERPTRIQGSVKIAAVHDVKVSELPVRVLGDCLRGSPVLHSSLPHTPAVRAQAALAIAQWQNNKAPNSKDAIAATDWVGLNLLIQYFRERFYGNSVVMPVKFTRLCLKKSEAEARKAATQSDGDGPDPKPSFDEMYQYLDTLQEGEERATALDEAEDAEVEEDEEYRVRSAVVTAIASIRAKDGYTPTVAIKFLETILEAEDAEMVGSIVYPEEELLAQKKFNRVKTRNNRNEEKGDMFGISLPILSNISSALIADALLALCHLNAAPRIYKDPSTGKVVQSKGLHPVSRLISITKDWLQWELYREDIRMEVERNVLSGLLSRCHDRIAACAIISLCNLIILKQSTMDSEEQTIMRESSSDVDFDDLTKESSNDQLDEAATAKFYKDILFATPSRNDLTRAASAQALACICCAADRFEKGDWPLGLLTALELLLDVILESSTSPGLRRTMAQIMMDACTGKVCSMQRIGSVGGVNDLLQSAARLFNGPLGASHGGDNGSAILNSVTAHSFPAASSVNDGARRGLRLISRAGHPKESIGEALVVRVARFATRLWRTINGEPPGPPTSKGETETTGICAFDGSLRCSLLALYQWVWPRGCFSVLQVQAWKDHECTQRYIDLGAHHVMRISEEEKEAAAAEDNAIEDINRLVNIEIDRQVWRGEMVRKAFDLSKNSSNSIQDDAAAEQGIGQPLPPIQRDAAFKQGGWIASAAQQRRALALDGGTAVTKVRLTFKNSND